MSTHKWKFRIQRVFGSEAQYKVWPADQKEHHTWMRWEQLSADQKEAIRSVHVQ